MSDWEIVFSVVIASIIYDFGKWLWKHREWLVKWYYDVICVFGDVLEWAWKKIRKK